MTNAQPIWMRTGWLPELKLIEWPLLEEMRQRHHELVEANQATYGQVPVLQERYAAEDRQVVDAHREAARKGVATPEIAVTPELRRQAEVEVAREGSDRVLSDLCGHVRHAANALLAEWPSVQATIDQTRRRLFPDRIHGDAPSNAPISISALEESGREADRKRQEADAMYGVDRIKLRDDIDTLGRLLNVTLAGQAENLRAEVARALGGPGGVVAGGLVA